MKTAEEGIIVLSKGNGILLYCDVNCSSGKESAIKEYTLFFIIHQVFLLAGDWSKRSQ